MKKVLLLILFILFSFGSNSFAAFHNPWAVADYRSMKCDQNFPSKKLRLWKSYIFYDDYNNRSSRQTKQMRSMAVNYYEPYDYNKSPWIWKFKWADDIKRRRGIIKPWEYVRIIDMPQAYTIKAVPPTRSTHNLVIQYFTKTSLKGWPMPKDRHTECQPYEITRCWDGVIDRDQGEECDGGPNCTSSCTLKTCWNWKVDPGEECDDWNKNNFDSCTNACKRVNDCDQTFNWWRLRYGFWYHFSDYFSNKWHRKLKIFWFSVYNKKDSNYNWTSKFSQFWFTPKIKNQSYIVNPWETIKLIKTKDVYNLNYHPTHRKSNNIFLRYYIWYYPEIWSTGKFDWTKPYVHTECVNYEVTRCGDWKLDRYTENWNTVHEACDPKDPKETWWWDGGCSDKCEPITQPKEPVCKSLTVSPRDWDTPLRSSFVCNWENSNNYKINLIRNWKLVHTINSSRWSYTFAEAWTYSATCYVWWKSSNVCNVSLNVKWPNPSIDIIKEDANQHDLDSIYDTQTVRKWEKAVFRITVTNNWTEDLRNIVLTDAQAPKCAWVLDFTNKRLWANAVTFAWAWNHGDSILQVWETFYYTCEKENTVANYTNIAWVTWIWIKTWKTVSDTDPSIVRIPDSPETASCTNLQVSPSSSTSAFTSNFKCTWENSNDYKIEVFNSSNWLLKTFSTSTWSYRFTDKWNYKVKCSVWWKTSSACEKTVSLNRTHTSENFCWDWKIQRPNDQWVMEECDAWTHNLTKEEYERWVKWCYKCKLNWWPWGWGGWGSGTYCGDWTVQRPNDDWLMEECDWKDPSKKWWKKVNWKLHCPKTCKFPSCAATWICEIWNCWPLNWVWIDITNSHKFANPERYHADFCAEADDILSMENAFVYSPRNKTFKWSCWIHDCSAEFDKKHWVLKVYWSFKFCPTCERFTDWKEEVVWDSSPHEFNSNLEDNYTRSIMRWDYLPFGWIVPDHKKYINVCGKWLDWHYRKGSLKVQFETDTWKKSWEFRWFNDWIKAFKWDISVNWQWYISSDKTRSLKLWKNKLTWKIVYRDICTKVWENWTWRADTTAVNSKFASIDFTVTEPYLLQKDSPLTLLNNTDIRFDGRRLNYFWVKTPNKVASSSNSDISSVVRDFVNRYSAYTVVPSTIFTENANKAPTQNVYYMKPSSALSIWNESFARPTTLIVDWKDVIINWDIRWSFMLVVKWWDIIIKNSESSLSQVRTLEWYYITDKSIKVNPGINILNTSPSSPTWHSDWRLVVKWVLVWDGLRSLYKWRRSLLKSRFWEWPNYAVQNWASLKIESNPKLWTNPPVGSKNLFEMIKIRKWQ